MTEKKLIELIGQHIEARRNTNDDAEQKELNETLTGLYNELFIILKEQNKKKK